MTADAFLDELAAAGIHLVGDGDALFADLDDGSDLGRYKEQIQEQKADLLDALLQRELDAEVRLLERGWAWLEAYPDAPMHEAFEARWIERLRCYERSYQLIFRKESDAAQVAPPMATHEPEPPDNDEDPDDPIADTAKRMATLSPDELQVLRAEIASATPDDPYAEFDRAALEHFDAVAATSGTARRGSRLSSAEAVSLGLDPMLLWAHVSQRPVEPSTPPPKWDGEPPETCGWPRVCRVLGLCSRARVGGSCRVDVP